MFRFSEKETELLEAKQRLESMTKRDVEASERNSSLLERINILEDGKTQLEKVMLPQAAYLGHTKKISGLLVGEKTSVGRAFFSFFFVVFF